MNDFNHKVFSIFEKLNYIQINDIKTLNDDIIIEKETILFVVRIIYKVNTDLVSEFEIHRFNENLISHYKLKGYLITNTMFNIDYSNNLYLFDKRIRLFDMKEIERLFNKN